MRQQKRVFNREEGCFWQKADCRRSKRGGFIAAVILLLLFTAVMGNSARQGILQRKADTLQRQAQEQNYREVEAQYRSQLQAVLAQEGYPNSGITMTYVTTENGDRSYTVQIHHRRLVTMKAEEQELLRQRVADIKLAAGACSLSLT